MPPRTASGPLDAAQLAEWYAVPAGAGGDPWVRASFITTLDGRAVGPDGRSGSLNEGSEGDHAVFSHLRDRADVVVVGAGTVRAEGYRPLPGVNLVVVSRSGQVPDAVRRPGRGDSQVVVLGGEGTPGTPREILDDLVARGWGHVLLEGGPGLFAQWLVDGLVDELCLTVRPVLAGGDGPLLLPREARLPGLVGSATHVLTWGGDVLLRTRLR